MTKGKSLTVLAHLKKIIVKVKSETNCLAHALIIAIAIITNDGNYKSYHDGRKIGPVVRQLLESTGINLDQGGVSENSRYFRNISKNIELFSFLV